MGPAGREREERRRFDEGAVMRVDVVDLLGDRGRKHLAVMLLELIGGGDEVVGDVHCRLRSDRALYQEIAPVGQPSSSLARVCRCDAARDFGYSGLTLAALMIGHHFSISAR